MSDTTSEAEQLAVVIMNRVQDIVMEWTTSPWPSSDGGEGEASSVVPLPTALIEDSMIRFFFGARQDPVLELPPVLLNDLR